MNIPCTLLGLLEPEPSHGYELKRAYDQRFGQDKPLPFGQVYATLGRFERDGRAVIVGTEPGEGPERKLYAITEQGVTDFWSSGKVFQMATLGSAHSMGREHDLGSLAVGKQADLVSEEAPREAKVVDLMERLRQSLDKSSGRLGGGRRAVRSARSRTARGAARRSRPARSRARAGSRRSRA